MYGFFFPCPQFCHLYLFNPNFNQQNSRKLTLKNPDEDILEQTTTCAPNVKELMILKAQSVLFHRCFVILTSSVDGTKLFGGLTRLDIVGQFKETSRRRHIQGSLFGSSEELPASWISYSLELIGRYAKSLEELVRVSRFIPAGRYPSCYICVYLYTVCMKTNAHNNLALCLKGAHYTTVTPSSGKPSETPYTLTCQLPRIK